MGRSTRTTKVLGAWLVALGLATSSEAAATKQVIFHRTHLLLGDGITRCIALQGPVLSSSAQWPACSDTVAVWSTPGTVKRILIHLTVAPGGGATRVFTVRKSASDTGLTVTFGAADVDKSQLTQTVTVAALDTLSVKELDTGMAAATDVEFRVEFDATTAGSTNYTQVPFGNAGVGSTLHPFNTQTAQWLTNTTFPGLPITATMARYDVLLSVAPGVGSSRSFVWVKNGTTQDGSGGTPNTTLTISNAATTGTWTGSLSLAQGDSAYIAHTGSGTPAVSAQGVGVSLTGTTDGESAVCGVPDLTNTTNTAFAIGFNSWQTNETNQEVLGGFTSVTFSKLYFFLANAPIGTYTFSFRKNQTSPAGTLSVTLSVLEVTGSDLTHSVSVGSTDTFVLQSVPTGGPNQRGSLYCIAETATSDTASGFPALTVAP